MIQIKDKTFGSVYFKYVILYLFSLHLLFSENEKASYFKQITLNLNVERFSIILLISMLIYLFFISFSRTKLDIVASLLLIRMLYSLTSFYNYSGTVYEYFEAGYFQVIFLTLLYIIAINVNIDSSDNIVFRLFLFISIILTIQIYYVFFRALVSGVPLNSIKYWIIIPMGESNFVAMMLSFITIFLNIYIYKSFIKKVLIASLFSAILLTFSDGAILSISFVTLIYYFDSIKNKNIEYILKVLLIVVAIFIAIIIPSGQPINIIYGDITFQQRIDLLFKGQIGLASSGRLDIYIQYINQIIRNPIFGNGFYKPNVKVLGNAHNFILQEAYNAGIFSLSFFVLALIYLMNRIKWHINNDRFIKASYYSTLYILFHSLIEPGLLGFKVGFYFWITIGLCVQKIRSYGEL